MNMEHNKRGPMYGVCAMILPREQYGQDVSFKFVRGSNTMRNLIASTLVVLGSVGAFTTVQAQIEVRHRTISIDPSTQLPHPASSLPPTVFHTVAVDLHGENVRSFVGRVSGNGECEVGQVPDSNELCAIGLKRYPSSDSSEFVDIQYDQGEGFRTDDGNPLFASVPPESRMSTRFIPKGSLGDNREVRIDRIWLAPYFDNQFGNTNLPSSAPRDLTVYIYSDQGGRPGDILFSKVIEDPRAFAGVTSLGLDFFELDLSNEGIGVLPDVVHVAYGNAGSDENILVIGAAPYPTENVSHLYLNDSWGEFWTVTVDDGSSFNGAMIPLRARFRLSGMGDSLQFVQQINNQSFLEGQTIAPLILPEATGGNSPIDYSLMPGLPAGLNFDSSTRTIHGTPVEVTATPVAYTYTATDVSGNTASLQFTIEIYSLPDGVEIVDIQYDGGEAFRATDGESLFASVPAQSRMSTRFIPKGSSGDSREVRIDRIWLAPYFDNQFGNTNLPSSEPRDLTIYIYSDHGGRPGDILFSKVIDDPRAFSGVTDYDLDFFELDLSNEGIGVLPDVIHIAYGNAGSDENILVVGAAPYATENVSHLYWDGSWGQFWNVTIENGRYSFNEAMIPIRARFRLSGTGRALQFANQIENQSFLEGQTITPLVLPEASGGDSPISYSLVPELPVGLNFDSSTRTILGTPTEITTTPVAFTYTATDASGNTVSLQFTIEIYGIPEGVEIVDIQYDQGEAFNTSNGGHLFLLLSPPPLMSTRFTPKASPGDDREVRIDRIWLAPYFDNQFWNTDLPSSAPRDLTVHIYSDQGGRPEDILFSKVVEDPRAFAKVTDFDLDFFELDLSNDGIGVLPDVIHIAYGEAGSDGNTLSLGPAPYATENVSHLSWDGSRWNELWDLVTTGGESFIETVIPIRARFRLKERSPVQVAEESALPEAFVVHGNYPNPFRKSTHLQFDLPSSARVTVEVIDMLGRRVLTVPPVELTAGWGKQIEVDGQSLPSGHYLYRLVMYSETVNSTQTGQFVHFR